MPGYETMRLMFIVKELMAVIFFCCLVAMLSRQREMINILKEIRDKK